MKVRFSQLVQNLAKDRNAWKSLIRIRPIHKSMENKYQDNDSDGDEAMKV